MITQYKLYGHGIEYFVNQKNTMKSGIELITDERNRQVAKEGYSAEHDEAHDDNELVDAAGAYACADDETEPVPFDWPWDHEAWKPSDRIRNLVKAGALIAAEIDRLQRLDSQPIKTDWLE